MECLFSQTTLLVIMMVRVLQIYQGIVSKFRFNGSFGLPQDFTLFSVAFMEELTW